MKPRIFKILIIAAAISLTSIIYFGCTNDVSPSLYSGATTGPSGGTPKINSVDPSNTAIAGVTNITITGENFLSDTSAIIVYFGKKTGRIITANSTQLTVIAPNVGIKSAVQIMISSNTAIQFSNTYDYTLEPAAKDFYPDAADQKNIPISIIADNTGNVYSSNSSIGVIQITQDSASTLYSPKGGETFWTGMRFGPNGDMYTARGLYAVFTIPAGGAVKNSVWKTVTPTSTKLSKIEFDPLGNLWAAGNNTSIFRFKSDKSYTSFPFDYNVTAMRVFVDNSTTYMYFAVQQDSLTKIIRAQIDSNGDLGSTEDFFDFSGNYGAGFIINDMTFAADGELFLATNLPTPIVYINKDKSSGILYPSILLKSPALSLAWGTGNYLYYVREQINDASGAFLLPQSIVRLNVEKPGAPYFGM